MLRKVIPLILAFSFLAAIQPSVRRAEAGEDTPPPPKGTAKAPVIAPATVAKAQVRSDAQTPRNVVKVLRTTDKAQTNIFVPRVFEVKNANPYSVSKFVEDAVSAEGGLIATYANPETEKNSGLILVVVPEYQLERIGQLIENLDRPQLTNANGTAWFFQQLKHRNVEDVNFTDSLLEFGARDNVIGTDVKTNSLMVTGAPSGVAAIRAAITDYDVPRDQIAIAVKIYEVEASNDATLGLDFQAWKNGPGQTLFELGVSRWDYRMNSSASKGRERMLAYSLDYPSEFFDFLTVKGKGRVVTELKGTVMNNFPATFTEADQILYYPRRTLPRQDDLNVFYGDRIVEADLVGRRSAIGDPNGEVAREGIWLVVTPRISRNNIDLNIVTEISTFLSWDDEGIPLVSQRRIETDVRAGNGEEVVLGRMRRVREIKTTSKIPLLGSLPIVGHIFGGETIGKKVTTVIEVITPTIIEESALTDEDMKTIDQVMGKEKVYLPADKYFFEQFWLD